MYYLLAVLIAFILSVAVILGDIPLYLGVGIAIFVACVLGLVKTIDEFNK